MFWISKVLPLALLPLGLILSLLIVGIVGRRRWPVITSAFLLWICSLGLVNQAIWSWLEAPWQRKPASEAPSADAIVVLSGGRHPAPGKARLIEWNDPDRFLAGLDLYRASKAPRLLFTGGANPFRPGQPPEGQLYLLKAKQLGIPSFAMSSTTPVLNTAEEAIAIRRLLFPSRMNSITPPRILLVTSAFHMRRAKKLFERQGLKVEPFPVDFQTRGSWAGTLWRDPTQWFPSAEALSGTSRALRELLGQLIYRTW